MIAPFAVLIFGAIVLASAIPLAEKRTVQALNQQAFAEAQQRDATATRAFSSIEIKTSSGQCLFVDELSGDFRANLTPIQVANCNGGSGQKWDIITSGKHNNVAGTMLVVSTLTQACLNFDPRRKPGNQVLLFSCGGRADGGGLVTNSQLFSFSGGSGPLALAPTNSAGTCLTVQGNVIDQSSCITADPNQSFTLGTGAGTIQQPPAATSFTSVLSPTPLSNATTSPASETPVIVNTSVISPIPVARAGGVLNPAAAAESNQRDASATRAFSSVSLKSTADGKCLSVNATAGDFRQNLIPVQLADCTGALGEKFDFITAGKHNDQPNSTLIVSTLTQGCLNFDARRAAGDTVIMFSCGGRADGGGSVTNSQLFAFQAHETSLRLAPNNGNGAVCLVPNAAGRLNQAPCNAADATQLFTIVG